MGGLQQPPGACMMLVLLLALLMLRVSVTMWDGTTWGEGGW